MDGPAFSRRLRDWLRRFDPGYRWLQAEVRRRDERIMALEGELAAARHALAPAEDLDGPATLGDLTADDLRGLDEHGLFVVGNARSGTSILCDCLNLSPEIMLLGEAHFCLNHARGDFAAFFNRKQMFFGNRRGKGTFAPPAPRAERGALALLKRLGTGYRYAGEKATLGPQGERGDLSMHELFFRFHARYFSHSKYVLIVRRPAETVWSMHKMFPELPLPRLFQCWLDSLGVVLDVLHTFPHAWLIFFEELGAGTFERISAVLGVEVCPGPAMLRDERKQSLLRANAVPEPLRPFEAACRRCDEIYQELKDAFCPVTLTFRQETPRYLCAAGGLSAAIHGKIEAALAELE